MDAGRRQRELPGGLVGALPLVVVGAATVVFAYSHEDGGTRTWDWLLAFGLGILLGSAEILSRYRDAPTRAMASGWAGSYVALNGAASVIALGLIRAFDFEFGLGDGSNPGADVRSVQVLVGGTAAMAVLRSSLFSVQVAGNEVAVGPAAILQVFLNVANEAVDRGRGSNRSTEVAAIMAGVSFERAAVPLPEYLINLRQNLAPEDAARVLEKVSLLTGRQDMDPRGQTLNLGLVLMNVFGPRLLREAVDALADPIRYRPAAVADLMDGVAYRKAKDILARYAAALAGRTVDEMLPGGLAGAGHPAGATTPGTAEQEMEDQQRSLALGLALAQAVGEDLLAAAVEQLWDTISREERPDDDTAPEGPGD
jgi:hypothetical protein